ncbi:FUSC family protein [Nocardioides sp. SYSU DS0651]|uniref:FUSC family protein n=1 Tax=Nocardioides sp. SYSU DS0651 TaxID=3415955 RepID=UPI003F4BDE44
MGAEIGRSMRTATAAVLAWLAVMPLGGLADDYPFYAPLGAVVAVTASVIGSVRETLQTIAAMTLGVAIAVLATPLPQVFALLVVVGMGTAVMTSVPGFERLGDARSWVPITGLFVLVLGGDHPWDYAGAYVGLTALGALVGLAVNALWPPLPLRAEARALSHVRDTLADRLDAVADSLRRDGPPRPEEWREQTGDLDVLVGRMRTVASQAGDARRVNWRVRRWATSADQRYLEARALERLAFLVEDLSDLLADQEHAEREHVALGPELRPFAADALDAVADVLRTVEDGIDLDAVDRARETSEELVRAMRRLRQDTGDDLITAGGVVTAIDRTLSSLRPLCDAAATGR